MKQSLELRLGQRLTITPQLQQAIKLLQLSSLDLTTEIQQALDENPLLEERDGEDEPGVGEQDNVTTENAGTLSGNDEREAAPDDEASMVSADESVTVGEEPEIDGLAELLKPFGIIEMVRAGVVAMGRADHVLDTHREQSSWAERQIRFSKAS